MCIGTHVPCQPTGPRRRGAIMPVTAGQRQTDVSQREQYAKGGLGRAYWDFRDRAALGDQRQVLPFPGEMFGVAGIRQIPCRAYVEVRNVPVFDHLAEGHYRWIPLELRQPLDCQNVWPSQFLFVSLQL